MSINNYTHNLTNGMAVLGRRAGVIFIRLPKELQTPIEVSPHETKGGWANACSCPYCKANPDKQPMWDTLAVTSEKRNIDTTWTVHMPDPRDANAHS